MTKFTIIVHIAAIVLFSATVLYSGLAATTGLRMVTVVLVGAIAPAMAFYEWFRAHKSTPEAMDSADRMITAFMLAMYGLASLIDQ
jgi:hypothetical protein